MWWEYKPNFTYQTTVTFNESFLVHWRNQKIRQVESEFNDTQKRNQVEFRLHKFVSFLIYWYPFVWSQTDARSGHWGASIPHASALSSCLWLIWRSSWRSNGTETMGNQNGHLRFRHFTEMINDAGFGVHRGQGAIDEILPHNHFPFCHRNANGGM